MLGSRLFWPLAVIASLAAGQDLHRELPSHGNDNTLLWGSYRPGVYVEIESRQPNGIFAGLMWSNADDENHARKHLRHTCEQNDGIEYGWEFHDPRSGGRQIVHDSTNILDLITTFDKAADLDLGETWSLHVSVVPLSSIPEQQKTMLVFYIGESSERPTLECRGGSNTAVNANDTVICTGVSAQKTGFTIVLRPTTKSPAGGAHNLSIRTSSPQLEKSVLWETKSSLLRLLSGLGADSLLLPNEPGRGTLHFIQLIFEGPGDFQVTYKTGEKSTDMPLIAHDDRHEKLRSNFDSALDAAYKLQPPFDSTLYSNLSRSLLSDLLGGIGFFHGTSMVSSNKSFDTGTIDSQNGQVQEVGPYSLLTSVPSRPFFPRGFLWDEGFHLMVILDWDMDLAVEVLMSWLDLMDEEGWIAREQILGPDARSRVPAEFQTQYWSYANPPTFFLILEMLMDRLTARVGYDGKPSRYMDSAQLQMSSRGKELVENIYDKLKLHYDWWRRTQVGDLSRYHDVVSGLDMSSNEGYRWRGSTSEHILTSGLDDYPRATKPSKDDLHIDALCWVDLMAQVLKKVATELYGSSDAAIEGYHTASTQARQTAENIHWSEENRAYCDTTISPAGTPEHICHKGYISLMPFITNTLSSDHIPAALDLISDPQHLWSDYGLRSLSTKDEFYGKGENYWRSPVWVNMNYLVLVRLLDLAEDPTSPHRDRATKLYTRLRVNIVNTVAKSWEETGMAWEQYDPATGKGQRTQHFTGWTSLIVRIMAMPHLDTSTLDALKPGLPALPAPSASSAPFPRPLLLVVMIAIIFGTIISRRRIISLCSKFLTLR